MAAAAFLLTAAGCHRAAPAATSTPVVKVTDVVDAETVRDDSTDGVRYSGSVIANAQVELSFKQGGYVEDILRLRAVDGSVRAVQQGDVVREGQVLARVRPGDYSARVAMAQAQRSQARAALAQAQAALLQARAGLDQAGAGLREAEAGEDAAVASLSNARTSISQAAKQTDEARIGKQAAEAQRSEASAAYTKARQDWERADKLYHVQSLTRTDYDAARAGYDVAHARLSQAEEAIKAAQNKIEQSEQQQSQARGQERQAVAQVDARRSQVRQAQARVDASRGAERAARAQVQSARAAISGASAQVDVAAIPLDETALRAPMNGVILRRNIEVGSLVAPGAPVAFTIADVARVKVVVGVPDTTVSSLRLGQMLPVRVEALGGKARAGMVTAISPAADPRTRVFNVEVSLANRDRRLSVGMIATVEITGAHQRERGVAVPLASLVRRDDTSVNAAVMVVSREDGRAVVRQRTVQLGAVYGSSIVVRGVEKGERVVTEGLANLRDGVSVQVASAAPEEDGDGHN